MDTDREIELREGSTVAQLFARDGEPAFRALESSVLAAVLSASDAAGTVVATGGGVVLAAVNRRELERRATTVYLFAPPERLAERLRDDRKRPLLQGSDVLETLRRLHAQREPLYREVADLVVDAEGSTASRIAQRIVRELGLAAAP